MCAVLGILCQLPRFVSSFMPSQGDNGVMCAPRYVSAAVRTFQNRCLHIVGGGTKLASTCMMKRTAGFHNGT
jgi:hypothetical protein